MIASTLRTLGLSTVLLLVSVPVFAQPPEMSALWPNQDGGNWDYEQRYAVAGWLGGGPDTVVNMARLRFDGTAVVPGGIVTQTLVEEVFFPSFVSDGGENMPRHPFLRRLWIARPDLREAIQRKAVPSEWSVAQVAGWESLLLHGGAFEKTADEIRMWRDNATALNWVFLVSDLTIGNTFTLQLVPDLADDVLLTGRIAALEASVEVPAGVYTDVVRVEYEIDFGESSCTSENSPDPTGTFRSLTTGFVRYAAGVGPIESHEEFIPYYEVISGDCGLGHEGETWSATSLKLTAAQPVSVESTSWSSIKTRPWTDRP